MPRLLIACCLLMLTGCRLTYQTHRFPSKPYRIKPPAESAELTKPSGRKPVSQNTTGKTTNETTATPRYQTEWKASGVQSIIWEDGSTLQ